MFRKFTGKIKILSIHNLFCRKFVGQCLSENDNFLPPVHFFNPQRRWYTAYREGLDV